MVDLIESRPYGLFGDSASGTQAVLAPRLSLGLAGPLWGGRLRIDMDLGQAQAGVVDAGLRLDFARRF